MAAPTGKVFELFVTKVPWTVAAKELKEYFGQFGKVKNCILVFDKGTGFHKGFCWVKYFSAEGMQNALQRDAHVLEGSRLQVQKNRRLFSFKKSDTEAA